MTEEILKRIITTKFMDLKWWEKIIGLLIVPVVVPFVFYKIYISKEW